MLKYLEITEGDFAGHARFRMVCEIHFWLGFSAFGFTRPAKFHTGCEIQFSESCSLSCNLYSFWHFACYAKVSYSHEKLLVARFLLWFSFLHTWLAWKRLQSSPKVGFFMYLSFNLLCHGFHKILPRSWLVLMIKKLQKKNIKTCQNRLITLARSVNVPIELKGINYY